MTGLQIAMQVCFHKQHFADPVNSCMTVHYRVASYMVHCSTTIRPHGMSNCCQQISWPNTDCGCFCALLKIQRLYLCADGWYSPPSAHTYIAIAIAVPGLYATDAYIDLEVTVSAGCIANTVV